MNFLEQHKDSIILLCKKHKVKELYAFGSVLDKNKFNAQSDVDLLVSFQDNVPVEEYVDLYLNLAEKLELLFDRRVEVLINKQFRNRFFNQAVQESKQVVYAA